MRFDVMDENLWSVARAIIGGLIAIVVTIGGWLWSRAVSDIRKLEYDMGTNALDLKDFKLHVAECHPTKEDLNNSQQLMRDTLSRLHDRIDVVSDDIKTLLREVGGK